MEQFLINKMPDKWEEKVLPFMALNNKLVLGGSLAMYILNIMEYKFEERTPDMDFSLTEAFNEDEFLSLIDFFNLSFILGKGDYEMDGDDVRVLKSKSEFLKNDLIRCEHVPGIDILEINWPDLYYKVDFFNKNFLTKRDWFELDYFGIPIKITHPSIILGAKMMYATDNRLSKQYKHFLDIKSIDWNNYFKIIKQIQPTYLTVLNEKTNKREVILDKFIFNKEKELPWREHHLTSTEMNYMKNLWEK